MEASKYCIYKKIYNEQYFKKMQTPLMTSLNLIIIFVLPFLNVDIPKNYKIPYR